jgi:hypothetical protein
MLHQTDPKLVCSILEGLQYYCHNKPKTQPPEYPVEYEQAVKCQSGIGWKLFIRGFWCTDWSALQERFRLTGSNKLTCDKWSAKMSAWWINKSYEFWTARNDQIHTIRVNSDNQATEEVYAQIQNLYSQAELLSANDREPLDVPIAERLLLPLQSLRNWIRITKPTIIHCVNEFSLILQTNSHRMTQYFQRRIHHQVTEQPNQNHDQLRNQSTISPVGISPNQMRTSRITSFFPWRDVRNRRNQVSNHNIADVRQESLS